MPAGGTEALLVTLHDDDYPPFVCLIEGHYEAGMHGDFEFLTS